jgi:hypothetical protein
MLPVIAGVFAFLMLSIVPTATYLYVEKRCRRHWSDASNASFTGVAGKAVRVRAPLFVRIAAWWSMAVGQLAIPWLIVPGACGTILYALDKVGRSSFSATALVAVLGVVAVLQSVFVFRLFPLGIRLLARDAKAEARARSVAVSLGGVSVLALATTGLTYMLLHVPGFLNPIVRVTLFYGVVIPIAVFAALGLVQSLVVARAGREVRPSKP